MLHPLFLFAHFYIPPNCIILNSYSPYNPIPFSIAQVQIRCNYWNRWGWWSGGQSSAPPRSITSSSCLSWGSTGYECQITTRDGHEEVVEQLLQGSGPQCFLLNASKHPCLKGRPPPLVQSTDGVRGKDRISGMWAPWSISPFLSPMALLCACCWGWKGSRAEGSVGTEGSSETTRPSRNSTHQC